MEGFSEYKRGIKWNSSRIFSGELEAKESRKNGSFLSKNVGRARFRNSSTRNVGRANLTGYLLRCTDRYYLEWQWGQHEAGNRGFAANDAQGHYPEQWPPVTEVAVKSEARLAIERNQKKRQEMNASVANYISNVKYLLENFQFLFLFFFFFFFVSSDFSFK